MNIRKSLQVLALACSFCFSSLYSVEYTGIEIHGYISQGYMKSDENDYLGNSKRGTFELGQAAINFSGNFTEDLRGGLQLFSRSLGDYDQHNVVLDWALLDYQFCKPFGIRIGKVKQPLGLYNEIRDNPVINTFILLPQGVYDETLRQYYNATMGGSLYGDIPLCCYGDLLFEVWVGNIGIGVNDPPINIYFEQLRTFIGASFFENNFVDPHYNTGGNIRWKTPIEGLLLGASYSASRADIGGDVFYLAGGGIVQMPFVFDANLQQTIAFAQYVYEDWTFSGEFLNTFLDTKTTLGPTNLDQKFIFQSYYVAVEYQYCDPIRLGTYYMEYFPDRAKKEDGPAFHLKDLAATIRYDVNDYFNIKIEGHKMDGTASVLRATDSSWYFFLVQATLGF